MLYVSVASLNSMTFFNENDDKKCRKQNLNRSVRCCCQSFPYRTSVRTPFPPWTESV